MLKSLGLDRGWTEFKGTDCQSLPVLGFELRSIEHNILILFSFSASLDVAHVRDWCLYHTADLC